MSYRTMLLVGFIVLFCIIFPSARIEHIFTGRFGVTPRPTAETPNPTPTQPVCTTDIASDTIDHTVCGGVANYVSDQVRVIFGQIGRNINENLISIGVVASTDSTSISTPTTTTSSVIITTFPYGLIYGTGFGTANNVPFPTKAVQTPQQPTVAATHIPSTTPQKLVTLTVTTSKRPVHTAIPKATVQALPTAVPTSEPTSAPTSEPTSAPIEPTTTTSITILPRTILDGFRAHMPPKGYWQNSADGVYLAVGSFRYLTNYYGADAPDKQRFVTLSVTIKNTRAPDGKNIYIDRTNFTMIDLDGRQTTALLGSDDLSLPLQATELAPGEKMGGQLVFLIHKYSAPAQIIVSVANMDEYLSRVNQTIELRVWPIVP